jgi:hypothetical protein
MIEEVARITHRAGIRSTRPASHGRTRRSAAGTEGRCLHDLIPNATVFVLLVNPNNPSAEIPSKQAAARAIGVQLVVLRAGGEAELDEVFASLTGQRIGGLIVSTDPFIYDQRDRIIASAAMIEIVSGDADLLSAAELLAYPSRACARGPREVQIFPYFLHKNPLQRRRVDIAIDANPTPALQLDLDQPRFLAPPATWGAIDRGRLSVREPAPAVMGHPLVISTATKDGSSEAPGTPISPSSAKRRHE